MAFTSAMPTTPGAPIGAVTWSLEGDDAGDFSIGSSTGVVSMVARSFESPVDDNSDNVYEVTVKATDTGSNTAMVSFTVTVTDVRESASLGITGLSNRSVAENTAFASSEPSITGTPIGAVRWSLGGTDAGDMTIDSSTGVVSMVARDHENPVDANTDNIYRATVTVTDADANSASVTFGVTVTDVVATLSVSGLPNRNVAENAAFTAAMPTLTGTPDGSVAWTIEGVDAGDFSVDASTGVVSMVGRDFENPVDSNTDNVYQVTLKAADDDVSPTASFTVTVTDVRETRTIGISGLSNASVAENARWTSPAPTVSGGAIGDVTWSKSGTDADDFTIDASTGALSMVARDYEDPDDADANNDYEVTVTATDADSNTRSVSITVTVTNVRESVTLGITGLSSGTVAENRAYGSATPTLTGTPSGDVTWTREGTDAADFTVDASTGVLSMVARNFEDPDDANTDNVYAVTVKATDEDANTATKAITVRVTDVQEVATITVSGLSSASTAENVAWTSSTPSATGAIGEVTWSKSGTDAGEFGIDTGTGELTLAARNYEDPDDADTNNVYAVTVTATDEDANTESTSIDVTVTDVQETKTLTITGLQNRSVAENAAFTSPTPSVSGSPIRDVTWSTSGTDAADFTINASTGVLSMVARNYEDPDDADTDNVYEVTVTATDADENSATRAVTVTVTDVRETATLAITGLSSGTVDENSAYTSAMPALSGSPDRGCHLEQGRHGRGGLYHRRIDGCAVDGGAEPRGPGRRQYGQRLRGDGEGHRRGQQHGKRRDHRDGHRRPGDGEPRDHGTVGRIDGGEHGLELAGTGADGCTHRVVRLVQGRGRRGGLHAGVERAPDPGGEELRGAGGCRYRQRLRGNAQGDGRRRQYGGGVHQGDGHGRAGAFDVEHRGPVERLDPGEYGLDLVVANRFGGDRCGDLEQIGGG